MKSFLPPVAVVNDESDDDGSLEKKKEATKDLAIPPSEPVKAQQDSSLGDAKPKPKRARPPKSAAQLESIKKAQEVRAKNTEERKRLKAEFEERKKQIGKQQATPAEASVVEKKEEPAQPAAAELSKKPRKRAPPKKRKHYSSDESSSDSSDDGVVFPSRTPATSIIYY